MRKITVDQLEKIGGYFGWISYIDVILALIDNLKQIEDDQLDQKVSSIKDELNKFKAIFKTKAIIENCKVKIFDGDMERANQPTKERTNE